MEVKRLREVNVIFLGWCEWPECPGQSRSPEINGAWEDPGREEILAGRGGSPGRPGGRPWAAGGEAGRGRGSFLGSWNFLPRGPPWGDHASCAKCPETEPKSTFSRGSRPGPLAGILAPPAALSWLHGGQFRVLLELRCSLTDAQSASGAKSGLPRGG